MTPVANFEILKDGKPQPIQFEDIKVGNLVRKLDGIDNNWKVVERIISDEAIHIRDPKPEELT